MKLKSKKKQDKHVHPLEEAIVAPAPATPKAKDGSDWEEVTTPEAQVKKGLEAIYLDEKTGEAPDLKKLDHKKSSGFLRGLALFTFFTVVFAGTTWAAFEYLGPYQKPTGDGLSITIEGPQDIALGKEETFTVSYVNNDLSPVSDAELRLDWPAEFVVTKVEPEPQDKSLNRWELGLLPIASRGEITVKGVFVGELGAHSTWQVAGTYHRNGVSQDAQVLESKDLLYRSTLVKGNLSLPQKIIAGDPVPIHYEAHQQGEQALQDVWLELKTPQGFDLDTSSTRVLQARVEGQNIYLPMGSLSPSATGTLDLVGSFPSTVFGDLTFEAALGRFGVDNRFLPVHIDKKTVPVLAGDLTVRLVVNGDSDNKSLKMGSPLRLALGYQNTSPEAIKNARIQISFESIIDGRSATGSSLLAWTKLEDAKRGATSTRPRLQTITFDKQQIPEFENLAPQAEGLIELTLPTMMAPSGTKNASIRVEALAEAPTVGGTKVNRIVRVKPIELTYRTDADLIAEARYFTEEGAPIGSGPLPPIAQSTTTYRVIWRIEKTFHSLNQIAVSTTLPRVASWTGKAQVDAGDIIYNSSTRSVMWQINAMPDTLSYLEASFDLAIKPEDVDIGRFATMMNASQVQFQDAQTKDAITLSKPALTTDLQSDESAKGKGVVRKELSKNP